MSAIYDHGTRKAMAEVQELMAEEEERIAQQDEKIESNLRSYEEELATLEFAWNENEKRNAVADEIMALEARLEILRAENELLYSTHADQIADITQEFEDRQARLCKTREIYDLSLHKLKASIAPIRRLPTEILAEVFKYIVEDGYPASNLREICKQWCQVADHNGELWRRICLTTTTCTKQSFQLCSNMQQLKAALKKTRNAKLIIRIDFGVVSSPIGILFGILENHTLEGFRNREQRIEAFKLLTLPEIATRWESFMIHSSPQVDDRDLQEIGFPEKLQLNCLSIQFSGGIMNFIQKLLIASESIRNLHLGTAVGGVLEAMDDPRSLMMWSTIQNLCYMNHPEQPLLLELCTNLRHLKLHSTYRPMILENNLTLPNLEIMETSNNSFGEIIKFQAPRLEVLKAYNMLSAFPAPLNFPKLAHLEITASSAAEVHNLSIPPLRFLKLTVRDSLKTNIVKAIFDGSETMPRPQIMHLISSTSDSGYVHSLKQLSGLKALRLELNNPVGKLFWDAVNGKKGNKTLCPDLEKLVISYLPSAPRSKRLLPDGIISELADKAASTRENMGVPLKYLMWENVHGEKHVLRGTFKDRLETEFQSTFDCDTCSHRGPRVSVMNGLNSMSGEEFPGPADFYGYGSIFDEDSDDSLSDYFYSFNSPWI